MAFVMGLFLIVGTSCEWSPSDDVEFATFSRTGEIFTDDFIGLGANFYFPFVGDGAKPDVFSVDQTVGYESQASIRIDVPNADDPAGNFAGASFEIDNNGARNLTDFDALTFWARSSQAATIGSIGFGRKYRASVSNVDFTTSWQKFVIPIPDPSKLTAVNTVFEFSAGGIGLPGQEVGYTFWIDELKFEKLGTVAQPRPAILNGLDVETESFVGAEISLEPLTQTFNLGNGQNQTTSATPAYFSFSSTHPDVARVDEQGNVTILKQGQTEITAVLNGVKAQGSLSLDILGEFDSAPIPPARNASDVISVFSGAYDGLPGLNVAIFNNPDIQIETFAFNNDQVISYGNLGFVGIGWNGTSDVSGMSFLHLDIQVSQSFAPSDIFTVELLDFGVNASNGGGDDTGGGYDITGDRLTEGGWVGIDIPVNGFTQPTGGGFLGSPNTTNLAAVVLVGKGISNVLVDNIYFYR